MNDITSISLPLKECSSNEADASNSNLNGNIDNKVHEKGSYKIADIDKSEDTNKKGLPMMSVSSSMQDHQLTVLRSNKSLCLMSSDYNGNSGSLNAVTALTAESASFALLSRRESSLENLAEDETGLHNVCISPYVDSNTPTIVEKPTIIENTVNIPKKIESSRLRRTISSLLSCCTHKSRRSQYPYKSDIITSPVGDSDAIVAIDKCSNLSAHKPVSTRPGEGDHISFSCLKLKKFLDIFDESDSPGKRNQQSIKLDTNRPVTTACVTREIDKSESPSKNMKNTESFQSENGGANLARPVLLGTIKPTDQGKKCFIIDLDETLVHSSFKMVEKADFKVGVDIEGTVHTVYVLKRPYVDVFLQKMGRIFECVLFTASLAKYADPVTDFLDKWRVFRWRLFRESCVFHRGNYVKDLSMLGRQADQVAILDNSPASYMFHPDNAVQITSWFDDPRDTALLDLIPYFEQLAAAPSVPPFLASIKPPQRATVPVSVMLTTPTSISLQPVSQQQLQNQQHKSSSPLTNVESSVITSSADHNHHHPNNNTVITNVPQLSQYPITSSLYIRDINIKSSLLTRSNISSKSLPSMMPSVEESFPTSALKFSRSETDLSTLLSSLHIESVPIIGSSEHDIICPLPHQKFSKSTSDIPAVLTYDDIYPKSILNSLASRSFPALLTNLDPKTNCYLINNNSDNKSSDNDEYEESPPIRIETQTNSIIIDKTSLLPRSASFSVHIFRTENNNTFRSRSSLCDVRITTTTTTTTGLFGSLFAD